MNWAVVHTVQNRWQQINPLAYSFLIAKFMVNWSIKNGVICMYEFALFSAMHFQSRAYHAQNTDNKKSTRLKQMVLHQFWKWIQFCFTWLALMRARISNPKMFIQSVTEMVLHLNSFTIAIFLCAVCVCVFGRERKRFDVAECRWQGING